MAQQTINVGASPNDGTGTPLRTAFQYTNSNFTELYTAVGPSGNNIVVPGTATITGDLTVDTNVLKVDTTNNRVGILTATPAYPLSVAGRISYSGAIGEGADTTVSSSGTSLLFGNSATWSETQFFAGGNLQYRVQSSGVFTWLDGAGGTRMTLNSTGLGVGGSPSARIHAIDSGGVCALFTRDVAPAAALSAVYIQAPVSSGFSSTPVLTFWYQNTGISNPASETMSIRTNNAERIRYGSDGNAYHSLQGTVPTIPNNGEMVFNFTSNTNLRISARGSDGITRVANITLA